MSIPDGRLYEEEKLVETWRLQAKGCSAMHLHPQAKILAECANELGALLASPLHAGAEPERAIEAKYYELLFAVASKYQNESRHETALRYIRQAEEHTGPASSSRTAPQLEMCRTCRGLGRVNHGDSENSTDWELCFACNGKGWSFQSRTAPEGPKP